MMFGKTLLWLLCFSASHAIIYSAQANVRFLLAGDRVNYKPTTTNRNELQIYCYQGKLRGVLSVFESLELLLDIANEDYTQYQGETPQDVREDYEQQRSLFSLTLFAQKRPHIQLSPFVDQCFGIATAQPYIIQLQRTRVDMWRCAVMFLGLFIFTHAARLSQNHLFYYIAGIVLGISASVLVVIYFVSKLLPKKSLMYGTMLGCWTLSLYLLKVVFENMRLILITYREYVICYIFAVGLISFFICYRFGPPTNPRSKRIIQWVLQAIGALLVAASTPLIHFSITLLIITSVFMYFPLSCFRYIRTLYYRRFPPKRRLLTLEEYHEEGIKETERSLRELRDYVNSPECKQFKVLSRLRDPVGFVKFANGSSHLLLADDDDMLFLDDDDDDDDDSETVQAQCRANKTMTRKSTQGVEISDDEDEHENEDKDFDEQQKLTQKLNRTVKFQSTRFE